MKFSTASATPRPVRLCEETRKFAWESMHGKYGDEARRHPHVNLEEYEGFEELSPIKKYDVLINNIVENAPVRICKNELVCGSATLGDGISHEVPSYYKGERQFYSISHLTVNYENIIKLGLNGYEIMLRNLEGYLDTDAEKKEYRESIFNTINAYRTLHGRYLDATKRKRPDLHKILERVPLEPARSFREAAQSLWFTFAFLRLCGNWPGIGRIDVLLGDYLKNDLADGTTTIDEAREVLASMFIKGCEWIESDTEPGSGDAQHYQNIVLGGIDRNGNEVTNEVTYLVLDIVEELAISDFPISIRLNDKTPEKLLKKAARVIRHGGGIVAAYNEKLVLEAMTKAGYSYEEACDFANDGCWEVQIPGKTDFGYMPFDSLQVFDRAMGISTDEIKDFKNMDEVCGAFFDELRNEVANSFRCNIANNTRVINGKYRFICSYPCTAVGLFEEGCFINGQGYGDYGTKYTVRSPHIGGAPDVANSLFAIKKAVFDDKLVTFKELIECVKNNWENNEKLRLQIKNKYTYYGNDNDEADYYMAKVLDGFADIVNETADKSYPVKFVPGVSTFGRQLAWLPWRRATVFGARKGEILAPNTSPTPGTDVAGATAVVKSYGKADLTKQTTGAALDLKIYPSTLKGENGLNALTGLLKGFLKTGGFFVQIDTVDAETLKAAKEHPEDYKTLSVRVSGWNARFVTLNKEWQQMIIEKTSYGM